MRKIFNRLVAVALTALATTGLAACGDDEADEPQVSTVKAVEWELSGAASSDVKGIFDYNVSVTLPDGTVKHIDGYGDAESAKVSGTIPVESLSLPAKFTMTITRTICDGFTPAEGQKVSSPEKFHATVSLVGFKGELKGWRLMDHNAMVSGNLQNMITKGTANKTITKSVVVSKNSDGKYVVE